MGHKARLLCVMQLPPPVHGVTVVNEQIVRSKRLAAAFDVDVVALRFADRVSELGAVSLGKLVRASAIAAGLIRRFTFERPELVYFTVSPQRPAVVRDCAYVMLARAFRIPRIVHVHARPTPGVCCRASCHALCEVRA